MTRKINHIGIAVNNIQDFMVLYRDVLGLNFSGEEVIEDQKVKVAFFDLNGSRIELLEPTSPDSPVAKFIEKKGEGMHHLAISSDNIEADLEEMKKKGIKLVDEVPRRGAHGTRIAFIHPKETKILLELTEEKH